MSDSLTLRIELVPFAVAIVLLSVSVAAGVVLVRKANQPDRIERDITLTAQLILDVVVGLVGIGLLFQGLFG